MTQVKLSEMPKGSMFTLVDSKSTEVWMNGGFNKETNKVEINLVGGYKFKLVSKNKKVYV